LCCLRPPTPGLYRIENGVEVETVCDRPACSEFAAKDDDNEAWFWRQKGPRITVFGGVVNAAMFTDDSAAKTMLGDGATAAEAIAALRAKVEA
jgi:hypothetical protein